MTPAQPSQRQQCRSAEASRSSLDALRWRYPLHRRKFGAGAAGVLGIFQQANEAAPAGVGCHNLPTKAVAQACAQAYTQTCLPDGIDEALPCSIRQHFFDLYCQGALCACRFAGAAVVELLTWKRGAQQSKQG